MENQLPHQHLHHRGGAPPPPQSQSQTPPQSQPPYLQPQHQQLDPNLVVLQSLGLLPNQNPFFQNANMPFQNHPNFPINNNQYNQNYNQTAFPIGFQHNNPNLSFSISNPGSSSQVQKQQRPNPKFPTKPNSHSTSVDHKATLDKIEDTVATVRRQFIQAGDHVSVWKLSHCALLKLQADSWDSLGFQLHQIPSLHQLNYIESKINAFIRCHVAVHKITTLFDLQEALCKNEGIENFEDLELGPFLKQPLVKHYFSLTKDVIQVYEITSDQIVTYLSLFLYKKRTNIVMEEFLDFVAKKCKVTNPQVLGLRIQSLGMHIGFLNKARNAQSLVLSKCKEAMKDTCTNSKKKKRPLFSLQKKLFDDRYNVLSERVTSFTHVNKDFCGQHIRFDSSSSDEFQDMTDSSDGEIVGNDSSISNQHHSSSSKRKIGDMSSSCPYPSVAEEMTRLGLKGESCENQSSNDSQRRRLQKRQRRSKTESLGKTVKDSFFLLSGTTDLKEGKNQNIADANESIRMFITHWKDACRAHLATEVLEKMLEFYKLSG
ncbi:unnamed protein product, partial [Amaranthus hypochondriacus]